VKPQWVSRFFVFLAEPNFPKGQQKGQQLLRFLLFEV
jgi:hypothetical protein